MQNPIKSSDWSGFILGLPEDWPQSLRTSLSILFSSPFPSALLWEKELHCFYNSAFKPLLFLANNFAPEQGMPIGRDENLWHTVQPFITLLLYGGKTGISFNQTIAFKNNGTTEECYTISLSQVLGEGNQIDGVYITATPEPVLAIRAAVLAGNTNLEQHFVDFIAAAPIPISVYVGREMIVEVANDAILAAWGKDRSVIGKPFKEALPEMEDQPFYGILQEVYRTGVPYHGTGARVDFMINGKMETFFYDFTYTPLRDKAGNIYGIVNTGTDLTQEVLAKKKAEENEELLQSLVHEAYVPTSLLQGPEHIIILANDVALKLWGKDTSIIGKRIIDGIPELEGQPYMRILDHVYETGITYQGTENRVFMEVNGVLKELFVNIVYKRLTVAEGAEPYILCMGYDVSDQVRIRKRIQENERDSQRINQQLAIALETGKLGSYEIFLKTGLIECSDQFRAIYGLPFGDAITFVDVIDLILPEDRDITLARIQSAIDKNENYNTEYRIRWPNGAVQWIKSSGRVLYDLDGNADKIVGVTSNITDNKLALQNVVESEERLNMALDYTGTATFDLNLVTRELIYSNLLPEIFGCDTTEKLEHAVLRSRIHEDDVLRVEKAFEEALISGVYFYEARIVGFDKELRWIRTQARIIYDSKNVPQRMLGTVLDITHARNEQNRKDEFIGIISHELRTPLTSIKAFGQFLHEQTLESKDEVSSGLLQKMLSQVDKLNVLIQDLLDVTKIEGGKMKFYFTDFDFGKLAVDVIDEIQVTTSKKIILANKAEMRVISGDRNRVEQVLINLLTNAIKYSPDSDRVLVDIHNDEGSVICEVTDFGIGISKENQPFVFDRFFREFDEPSHSFPGLGLGLYISAEIIQRQNGKIWVTSTKGKGSTFGFSMPLQTLPPA